MIGKLIKDEMQKQGITGKAMSKQTGIPEGGLSNILNDKANPTVETIERLVKVLGWKLTIKPKGE